MGYNDGGNLQVPLTLDRVQDRTGQDRMAAPADMVGKATEQGTKYESRVLE